MDGVVECYAPNIPVLQFHRSGSLVLYDGNGCIVLHNYSPFSRRKIVFSIKEIVMATKKIQWYSFEAYILLCFWKNLKVWRTICFFSRKNGGSLYGDFLICKLWHFMFLKHLYFQRFSKILIIRLKLQSSRDISSVNFKHECQRQ